MLRGAVPAPKGRRRQHTATDNGFVTSANHSLVWKGYTPEGYACPLRQTPPTAVNYDLLKAGVEDPLTAHWCVSG